MDLLSTDYYYYICIGGATRAAMTQHHAIRSNLADVSAKDSAQETAVNLIASMAALMIITVFGYLRIHRLTAYKLS